jgi:hypothetical protein
MQSAIRKDPTVTNEKLGQMWVSGSRSDKAINESSDACNSLLAKPLMSQGTSCLLELDHLPAGNILEQTARAGHAR